MISLSMIVKNEEKFLAGCLESVQGIVREIVINDTGSTDSTKQIAKKFGAKLIETTWEGNFAQARNIALEHCTHEWILYLDADERVREPIAGYIHTLIASTPADIGAYLCKIVNPHQVDGRTEIQIGGYPRLFRNGQHIRFQGRVHEQISPAILEAGLGIAESHVTIEHLGYNQSDEIMQQKVRRNYELLLANVREEPDNAYAWMQLGFTLSWMKLNDQAEQALKFAMSIGTLSHHLLASITANLAHIAGTKSNFNEAFSYANQSLEYAPNQVYALNLRAFSELYLCRFEDAERDFLEVQRRILSKRGIPQTGFDISLDPVLVETGLDYARKRIIPAPPQ